ncbi:MAG: septal ring lytic transglycosylase RlpA family protein [Haliscomenobacter sp.]
MRVLDNLIADSMFPFLPADCLRANPVAPRMRSLIGGYTFLLFLTLTALPTFLFGQESEIGWANFYSDIYQGKQTAYGEIYDRNQFTCAHPDYPLGTLLRITRLDNQSTVMVRVNDKGPHAEGFLVTMSMGAASAIQMAGLGKARVLVEPVALTPSSPIASYDYPSDANYVASKGLASTSSPQNPDVNYPSPAPNQSYYGQQETNFAWNSPGNSLSAKSPQAYNYSSDVTPARPVSENTFSVQLGAFSNLGNAEKQLDLIRKLGVRDVTVHTPLPGTPTLYKITAGSFQTRAEADLYKKTLLRDFRLSGFIVELF